MTSNARLPSLQRTQARAQSSSPRQRSVTPDARPRRPRKQTLTHTAQLALVEAGLLVPLGDHSNVDLVMARTR